LLGESISYNPDAAGNIIQQNNRSSTGTIAKTQRQVFDGLSRLLQAIGAAGQTSTYGYDNNGNRVTIIDGLNSYTARAFDPLNRLVSIIDPLNNATGLGYDAQDNNTTVTDPRSLVTTYVYDGFGHVIQESSPDRGTTVYLLDEAGNRTSEVDARGIVTVRTFDKLNRVVTKTFPASASENITYKYDATNGGNFGVGHLTGYADETGSTSLNYNERGDVITVARTTSGVVFTTTYGYDIADNVTSILYPSGHVITYTRDAMGRISSVVYQPSVSGTPTALASSVTYAPFGPVTGLLYGNGVTRTNVYDEDYRITGIITAGSSAYVQNLAYAYNPVNNITAITDNLAAGNNQTFAYDSDYRLTQAVGNYGTEKYAYDPDGNRLSHVVGGITENYNYAANANLLQSTVKSGITRSFSYTANGNVSGDNRGTITNLVFGYGDRNRYKTLTAGSTPLASYSYNALGERLTKTVSSTTTVYHYDQKHHLIAESQSNATLIREYVWLNDMPMAQIESSGSLYYIHPDHLNRPQKMADANQNIVWDNEPQPFGEPGVVFYLASSGFSNNQFQIQIGGLSTYNCIVQASTNLSNWMAVSTNAGPFTFADASTPNNETRFYRILYTPTSVVVGGITNNLRFAGQYYDAESVLHYNIMRDYDPTLGKYIQSDPIGLHAGINPYVYATNNPVMFNDLLGLDSGSSEKSSGDPNVGDTLTTLGVDAALESVDVPVPVGTVLDATAVCMRLPALEQAMQDKYENWGETIGEWDKRNPSYSPDRWKRWQQKQTK
jgi:RHS repeat-associated protein